MAASISAQMGIEGGNNFNAALKNAVAQAKSLKAQMGELTAAFSGTGKNAEYLTKQNSLLTDSIKVQRAAMVNASDALEKEKSQLALLANALDSAKSKYADSSKAVQEATAAYGAESKEVKKVSEAHIENGKELDKASTNYNKQAKVVADLETKYYTASTQVNNMTNEIEENSNTIRDIERGYNDAGNAVDEFGNEVKDAGNEVDDLGNGGVDSVGKLTTAFAAAQLAVDLVKSAVREVMSHLGDALDRIDTAEQFTRTMTVMLGTAEAANSLLEDTKAIVSGTAYSLTTAAEAVQSFTLAGMNSGTAATTVESLANAVAFYGDNTDSTLAQVTTAFSKMVSANRVDMTNLNSIIQANIPILDIWAESTGKSVADIRSEISAGTVSVDEFASIMNRAFEEGTTTFPAIANAAHEAGASWQGTFDNFNAAITRGLQAMVEESDKALQNAGMGSFRENIAAIGKQIEEVLTAIGAKLPAIVSVLSVIKPFAPLILGIIAAIAGLSIIADISKKIKLMQDAVKGVSSAVSLLMAHPIIAGIALVVAALVLLWNNCEGFRNFVTAAAEVIGAVVGGVVDAMVEFFTVTLPAAFEGFKSLMSNIWQAIQDIFTNFSSFLSGVFEKDWSTVFGGLGDVINAYLQNIKNVWDGVKQAFDGIMTFIQGVFAGNWEQAWEGIKEVFAGVFNALVGIAKAPINAIIGLLNGAISGINTMISGVNNTKIAGFLNVSIPTIPKIPMLAEGAVIPPNREFLAMLGDQSRGYNIETPEKLLREVVREESGGGAGVQIDNIILQGTFLGTENEADAFVRLIGDKLDEYLGQKTSRRAAANGG